MSHVSGVEIYFRGGVYKKQRGITLTFEQADLGISKSSKFMHSNVQELHISAALVLERHDSFVCPLNVATFELAYHFSEYSLLPHHNC